MLDRQMPTEDEPEERESDPRHARIGLVVRLEHAGKRRRLEHGSVLVGAAAEERRDVARHVPRGRVDRRGARGHPLTVDHGPRAVGPQRVARRQSGPDQLGPEEVGVGHAEGLEDVLAKVAGEGLPADVLDDLAERGEPVVGVDEPCARFGRQAETAAVVLGKRRQLAVRARSSRRSPSLNASEMRSSSGTPAVWVSRWRTVAGRKPGLRRDQPVGAQVVVRGGIEVDQPLLPQLHHRDRREGLGDGGDPEDRVLGDGRASTRCLPARVRGRTASRPPRTTPTARPTAGQRLSISSTRVSRSSSSNPG